MATPDQRSINFYPTPDRPIPKPILFGAGLLAIVTLVAIGAGKATGIGISEAPILQTVAHRDVKLDEHADGSVAIVDASTQRELTGSGPGEGSFAVEALRNLQRNRERKGVDTAAPFVVALKSDGSLVVEDPQTTQRVELRAFGERQAKAFAAMLPSLSQAGGRAAK